MVNSKMQMYETMLRQGNLWSETILGFPSTTHLHFVSLSSPLNSSNFIEELWWTKILLRQISNSYLTFFHKGYGPGPPPCCINWDEKPTNHEQLEAPSPKPSRSPQASWRINGWPPEDRRRGGRTKCFCWPQQCSKTSCLSNLQSKIFGNFSLPLTLEIYLVVPFCIEQRGQQKRNHVI